MSVRPRTIASCAGLMLAIGTGGVGGVAQAARPGQPTFNHASKIISESLAVTVRTGPFRIFYFHKALGVRCTSTNATGTLEVKGRAKTKELTYTKCTPFVVVANSEEEAGGTSVINTTCAIKSPGAASGELKLPKLKSRLVWEQGKNVMLNLYEPEKQPIVTMEFVAKEAGVECAEAGEVFKFSGSWLAAPTRPNEEALLNTQLVEIKSPPAPLYGAWEVKEGSGALETGEAVVSSVHGKEETQDHEEAFEYDQETELEPVGTDVIRGLFGVHE